MKTKYNIIGLMSGTSLDGLDIIHCTFTIQNDSNISYSINSALSIDYSNELKKELSEAHILGGLQLIELHNKFGNFLGDKIKDFIKHNNLITDLISSHGHTIFHQPEKSVTFQIGNGANICAKTQITTISDFRTMDVALSGQGAPLVPIGDKYLFPEYKYCLNLGGFANISKKENDEIYAYDIGPCNIALNHIAKNLGYEYDKDGAFSQEGEIHSNLLEALNNLEYFEASFPKSLGREWFESEYLSTINKFQISEYDILRTITENIAIQITKQLDNSSENEVLVTGGGAYNTFLISRIKELSKNKITIPENKIVEFKEALIFAYLGLLRFLKKENILNSVTGATKNSIGGIIHYY